MKKYQLVELISELLQDQKEIKATHIDYKLTEDRSSSMTVITKDEDLFEVRVRRI